MQRIAMLHPFLALGVLTAALPALQAVVGLPYDQAPLGTLLFAVSYVLLAPVMFVIDGLYFLTGVSPSWIVGVTGWVVVLGGYLGADVLFTRWANGSRSART